VFQSCSGVTWDAQRRIERAHHMKHFYLQRFVVLGALTLGLGACAAAAPGPINSAKKDTDIVAAGPIGPGPNDGAKGDAAPPPPPPPPPDVDKNVGVDAVKKPILTESMEGGVEAEKADRDDHDGAADPLMPAEIIDGSVSKPGAPHGGQGVAAGGKAARGDGRATNGGPLPDAFGGGGTTGGFGTIGAASEVRGSLDKEEIRRVIRAHLNEVKRGYDQGLTRRPELEGKVALKFTIGRTGTVVSATVQETTMNDRQVEQCIIGVALKWTFPKPTGEGVVTISYPFVFKSGA